MNLRITAVLAVFLLISMPVFAGASNNTEKESKQQIKQIEEAEEIDQELGATEGIKPEPVKKEKSQFDSPFQARSGFQQQPEITTAERR